MENYEIVSVAIYAPKIVVAFAFIGSHQPYHTVFNNERNSKIQNLKLCYSSIVKFCLILMYTVF